MKLSALMSAMFENYRPVSLSFQIHNPISVGWSHLKQNCVALVIRFQAGFIWWLSGLLKLFKSIMIAFPKDREEWFTWSIVNIQAFPLEFYLILQIYSERSVSSSFVICSNIFYSLLQLWRVNQIELHLFEHLKQTTSIWAFRSVASRLITFAEHITCGGPSKEKAIRWHSKPIS